MKTPKNEGVHILEICKNRTSTCVPINWVLKSILLIALKVLNTEKPYTFWDIFFFSKSCETLVMANFWVLKLGHLTKNSSKRSIAERKIGIQISFYRCENGL